MKKVYHLIDYKAPEYTITHIKLIIDISHKPYHTTATLHIKPNCETPSDFLILDGQNITPLSIELNDHPLEKSAYELIEDALILKKVPKEPFILTTKVKLGTNSDLFGLYETEGVILVKSETEGFRRMTYFLDGPHVLATYETTIIAKKKDYPCLLSNGDLIKNTDLNFGVHSATFLDNKPKPSYLFAMVAGKLVKTSSYFTQASGKKLPIEFYLPKGTENKSVFAQEVLKLAMQWEEKEYGLSCNLNQYRIAGVNKYASGASETTGLNLFNLANLLATQAMSTDLARLRIMEVVSHEFFHNKTGNEVTIKNWFNLPFKEGLTTFRAMQFRKFFFGIAIVKLLDGKNLIPEAPRPESYTDVRSLYTAAAYEKSAHIFEMMSLCIGENTFNLALAKFLSAHQGMAVDLEQLLTFLSNETQADLNAFLPWFTEEGIPKLTVTDSYDEERQMYTLTIKTEGRKNRPIPILMGLLCPSNKDMIVSRLLMLTDSEQQFEFKVGEQHPIPSLLRNFSAPVHIHYDYTLEQLLQLMRYETNDYNRCEAAKKLMLILFKQKTLLTDVFFDTYQEIIQDHRLSPWIKAELLSIPSEEELITQFEKPDFEKIAHDRLYIQQLIANKLHDVLHDSYARYELEAGEDPKLLIDIHAAGIRKLQEVYQHYFKHTEKDKTLNEVYSQFKDNLNINMTKTISALKLLSELDNKKFEEALKIYYDKWQNEPNAIYSWLSIQASIHSTSAIIKVEELLNNPEFFDISNPNQIFALLRPFSQNPYGFHAASGEGYALISNTILRLEKVNPTLAARLLDFFNSWNSFDDNRKNLMSKQLAYLSNESSTDEVRNALKKLLGPLKEYEQASGLSLFNTSKFKDTRIESKPLCEEEEEEEDIFKLEL